MPQFFQRHVRLMIRVLGALVVRLISQVKVTVVLLFIDNDNVILSTGFSKMVSLSLLNFIYQSYCTISNFISLKSEHKRRNLRTGSVFSSTRKPGKNFLKTPYSEAKEEKR